MNELDQLKERINELENIIKMIVKSDRYIFQRDIQFMQGRNIQLDTETGTKIGTSSTEKLALWGATPIVRPSTPTQAPNRAGTYSQSEAQDVTDAINDIRTDLINFGFYS